MRSHSFNSHCQWLCKFINVTWRFDKLVSHTTPTNWHRPTKWLRSIPSRCKNFQTNLREHTKHQLKFNFVLSYFVDLSVTHSANNGEIRIIGGCSFKGTETKKCQWRISRRHSSHQPHENGIGWWYIREIHYIAVFQREVRFFNRWCWISGPTLYREIIAVNWPEPLE